jgi:hypothetical protein
LEVNGDNVISSQNNDTFKVFISYKEDNGSLYAELLHLIFSKVGVTSFVAHLERHKHTKDIDNLRREVLRQTQFFIFINTEGALSRRQVKKEFNMAYPNHDTESPYLIIIHHKNNSPRPTPNEFKTKVGVIVKKSKNIPTFRDEDELIDIICELAKTHKITAGNIKRELVKKELRLVKYLKCCSSLRETKNSLDNTTLSQLYIPNDCVLTEITTWNVEDDKIVNFDNKKWTFSEFLISDNKHTVIGAPYGVGKTYFSYNLASELASKALKNFSSEIIPVHIQMKYGLNKIDSKGNNLDNILSLIPRDRRILFILDALDEFSGPGKLKDVYRRLLKKFGVYSNSKVISTTTLPTKIY